MTAKFNLNDYEDRDLFRQMVIEDISQSEKTWDDVDALHSLSFGEYYEPQINGGLYEGASYDPSTLLVDASQMDEAEVIFDKVMATAKDDYFQNH